MNASFRSRGSRIEPFWMRLRQISFYPLQIPILLTILLLAIARLLKHAPSILGLILDLILLAALYKFAADVLLRTASGRMDPPSGYKADEGEGWDVLKLQILFVILLVVVTIFTASSMGLTAAYITMGFIALANPGATMSVVTDQNLWHALNPLTWLNVMARMGWPYFVVSLLCMAFYTSEANMQRVIAQHLPWWASGVAADFVSHYVIIATFHLMGYLMYQYHEKIGWEIEERVDLQRAADPYQQLLDQTEALAREGKHAEAEELLRAEIFSRGASIAVHERYRKLLALRGDPAQSTKHGREFLNTLLAQDQDRKAVELYRECLAADPAFLPAQAEQIGRLAQKAADGGNAQLALRMLSGFHRHFPKNKDIPKNYLLAAKLLAEKMNQEAPAKALLEQVRAQFPGHPLLPEVENYLKFLDNLLSAAPRKNSA